MLFQERAIRRGIVRLPGAFRDAIDRSAACSSARTSSSSALRGERSWIRSRQTLPEPLGVDAGRRQRFRLQHGDELRSHEQLGRATYGDSRESRCRVRAAVMAGHHAASSAGFTSLQKTSIVCLASSSVMSPTGICSTM